MCARAVDLFRGGKFRCQSVASFVDRVTDGVSFIFFFADQWSGQKFFKKKREEKVGGPTLL